MHPLVAESVLPLPTNRALVSASENSMSDANGVTTADRSNELGAVCLRTDLRSEQRAWSKTAETVPLPHRIVRIITRLSVGGAERYVCSLTGRLDRRKFLSELICGKGDANEREWLELAAEEGIMPIYVPEMRRGIGPRDAVAMIKIARLLRELKPAIVETHTAKAGALGRISALLAFGRSDDRPRLIHTFHGHVFGGYFKGATTTGFIAIERALARFTDLIVTVSPRIRRELVEQYRIAPAEKVRVVPLGFDFGWVHKLDRSRGWLRSRLGVGGSTVLFGAVGRFAKIKNTALILRAFARLIRAEPIDARLVLIGDGEMRAELESLARSLQIEQHVMFCGWILDRALVFSDLDVMCLSSFNEGLPVCLIESLAASVPVVATDVGGVSDLVVPETDGELVTSNDEVAFAKAMGRMARKRSRVEPERSAALRERHSTARMVASLESIYEGLLGRGYAAAKAGA